MLRHLQQSNPLTLIHISIHMKPKQNPSRIIPKRSHDQLFRANGMASLDSD